MKTVALVAAMFASTSALTAQAPSDPALFRQLGTEVRQVIRARPGASNPAARDENGLLTDLLVRIQIQSRDLGAALETATSLNGTPRAFQWIADEHRKSGDRAALLSTITASPDREALASTIARLYVSQDSLDLASQVITVLLPSYVRRQLDAEIAVARAGHGDWGPIEAIPLAQFAPPDRVDLLTRLGDLLRRNKAPQLDSIVALASAALAEITDPTERETASLLIDMRLRDRMPRGFVQQVTMNDRVAIITSAEIDTATRGPAYVQRVRNRAVTETRRDGNLTVALKTLTDPAVVADTLSLVQALIDIAAVIGNTAPTVDSTFFATLARAESLAERTDSSSAETARVRIVQLLARRDAARARAVVARIKGHFARTRGTAWLIRQVMTTDVQRAISEAVMLRPNPVADTLLREAIVVQVKSGAFAEAMVTRQRIEGTELRRLAAADIALAQRAAGRREDAVRALEQLLGELDPWLDYVFASRIVVPALIELGRTGEVLTWARGRNDLRGAYARMAVMSALMGQLVIPSAARDLLLSS